MICKNCGHEIFQMKTQDKGKIWIHDKTVIFKNAQNEKNLVKALQGRCGHLETFETVQELEVGEITFSPMCGCRCPEPKEEK